MSINKELSDEEFEALSLTKKKQYVAELIIKNSGAKSIPADSVPVAVVMAGVPGAGKTEFLDTFSELIKKKKFEALIRIDLDEIVTIFPGYTPRTDSKFRSQGNLVVAKCVDTAIKGRYNVMVDGTFSGTSGVSVNNIERLLNAGYFVQLFLMHDDLKTSWEYTKAREKLTSRGIGKEEFIKSCQQVTSNVLQASNRFSTNKNFKLWIVLQKELRDREYNIVDEKSIIDTILNTGYNIDSIKDTL